MSIARRLLLVWLLAMPALVGAECGTGPVPPTVLPFPTYTITPLPTPPPSPTGPAVTPTAKPSPMTTPVPTPTVALPTTTDITSPLPTVTASLPPSRTPRLTLTTSTPRGRILFTVTDTEQWAARHWQEPRPRNIWIINVDGTGHRRWVKDDWYTDGPHVSPDGTQVAYYMSSTEDESQPARLWIANVDGTHCRPVDYLQGVTQPETVKGFGLGGWSPNGEWLSYYLVGPGDWRRDPIKWLYVIHPRSGRTTLVCGPQNSTLNSQWVPTEKTVLTFESSRHYGDLDPPDHYYRVDVTRLQDVHQIGGSMPQWTATGQMWTYSLEEPAFPSVSTEAFTGTIKILAPNGSVMWQISVPNMEGDVQWSPDGQWIAYQTSQLVQSKGAAYLEELWVMDSRGQQRRKLIGYEQFDLRYMPLVWSPDSTWLAGFGIPTERIKDFRYITSPIEGALFLVDISTGKVITLLEGIEPYLDYPPMVWVQ